MPVNFSIKNVPDAIAARLRTRATANHRSLQRELMAIIESAASTLGDDARTRSLVVSARGGDSARRLRPIEEIVEEWRRIVPHSAGGPSSVEIIRKMRDERYGSGSDRPGERRRR